MQFDMDIQTCFPPALVALHKFIHKHDLDNITDFDNIEDLQPGVCAEEPAVADEGQLAEGLPRTAERQQTNEKQDMIVQEMWVQYQAELS